MIGFKDQAVAPAGVRSPELWGQEYGFPWAEGSLGWRVQGVWALPEGTGTGGAVERRPGHSRNLTPFTQWGQGRVCVHTCEHSVSGRRE